MLTSYFLEVFKSFNMAWVMVSVDTMVLIVSKLLACAYYAQNFAYYSFQHFPKNYPLFYFILRFQPIILILLLLFKF